MKDTHRDTRERPGSSRDTSFPHTDEYQRIAIEQENAIFGQIDYFQNEARIKLNAMETTLDKIHQLSDNIAAEREDYKECADFIKSSLNLSHHTDLYKLQVSIQTVITYKKIIADLTKQIISFKKLREDTSKSNKDSVDQFPIIKEQLRTNQNNPAFIGYNGLYLSRERKYKENLEHCRKLRDSYTHFLTTEGNQVPEGDIRYHINSLNVLVSPEEIQEANKLLIDSWD